MEIILILILIIINGLFSMSEISLVSSRKSKLESQYKRGDKKAKKILETSENPENFLSTVQIAITVIGFITGLYSGRSLVEPFSQILVNIGVSPSSSTLLSNIIIILTITYLTLVIGELLPKKIGLNNPEKIAGIIISPMNFLTKITYPIVWFLSASTNLLLALIGINKNTNSIITEEEIKLIISESTESGEIREVEQDIVERVFNLGDRDVSSLMTHRSDFEWIDINDDIQEVRNQIEDNLHSLYPVADQTIDNIIGVVYLKDLFNQSPKYLRTLVKEPLYIPESASVYHALEVFKYKKIHNALVIDEFGVICGLVTLKDILESLVGRAEEMDISEQDYEILKLGENSWIIDGQYPFFDFLSYFDIEDENHKYQYNTLSGLLLDLMKKVPKIGDNIEWSGFSFEIKAMDIARIDKVIIRIIEKNQ